MTISETFTKEQYLKDAEHFLKIKSMIYEANKRLELQRAYKRTGDYLFCSTTEIDNNIDKWAYIESRLKKYALSKVINLLINT